MAKRLSFIMTAPGQLLIYQSEDGSTRIDVMLEADTLWLDQKQLTALFGRAKGTLSEHIKHIFEDGKQYEVGHCNFDMVLARRPRRHPPAEHGAGDRRRTCYGLSE